MRMRTRIRINISMRMRMKTYLDEVTCLEHKLRLNAKSRYRP